ncbi:tRNA (adenosine(37)-N6)-threonylcarbamoyltransferase complex dimerization subunit type 1 TsaB [Paracoccus sp. p4-l81]|uniref:tRNA (adenosine(37)-N6)-threonylcarbamoyltransferase complex dimerization subunit type 1 TsaB n=1 Tax=Paracoccus sp. p4-l81 TaxID=3342806 RepID=UPI0035B7A963
MRSDPTVLAFDTSAAHCAAALLRGGAIVASVVEAMDKGQAERLMPLLQSLLAGAGIGWGDLDGIGVGVGPGNFTGVRISVAAARGIALAAGIPAVGVTTLEAAALDAPRPVTVALDARRGAVYAQGFDPNSPPALLDVAPAGPLIGDIPGATPPAHPIAEAIARIAATRLDTPQPRPAPLYLRPADAAPPRDPAPVILP